MQSIISQSVPCLHQRSTPHTPPVVLLLTKEARKEYNYGTKFLRVSMPSGHAFAANLFLEINSLLQCNMQHAALLSQSNFQLCVYIYILYIYITHGCIHYSTYTGPTWVRPG
jgi:hypothetical protein